MIEATIWDFHGTLADVSGVLPLLQNGDYDGFYEGSLSCPPNESVVLAAQHAHRAGYSNLLLTGMPERYYNGLQRWLAEYEVPVSFTLMRLRSDGYKKDFVVKARMYTELLDLGYYVVRAWEDSPPVIDLWRRQGIPVTEIPRVPFTAATEQVDNAKSVT